MRVKINNIEVNYTNLEGARLIIQNNLGRTGYMCLPDAFVLALAEKNKLLSTILNKSLATFPDGKLLELIPKMEGRFNISTVSGYFLLDYFLDNPKISHFFYGSNKCNLNKLKNKIRELHPESNIIGYMEAPYIELNEIENNEKIF